LVDDSGDGSERLRWSDLEEAMTTGLVTVGAHTHDHANLAQATEHEALEQMRRSKELVEDRLGSACRHFAYPWSVASPAAEAAAAQLFQTAALPVWRVNRRRDLDPLRLGRTPVLRSDIGRLFVAKTRGFLNGEALAYRVLRRGPWSWS
jgi:peptidoglycan/xylan/chitin deacetylase (PgdA/CDA1 family)